MDICVRVKPCLSSYGALARMSCSLARPLADSIACCCCLHTTGGQQCSLQPGQFGAEHPLPHACWGSPEHELGGAVVPGLAGCRIQQQLPVHLPPRWVHPAGVWGQQPMHLSSLHTPKQSCERTWAGDLLHPGKAPCPAPVHCQQHMALIRRHATGRASSCTLR